MRKEEAEKRCEELIEVLQIKFRKKSEWSEPRTWTTWGTKTRKGTIAIISKIMYEDNSPDLLGVCEAMLEAWDDPTSKSVGMRSNAILNMRTAVAVIKMEKEEK